MKKAAAILILGFVALLITASQRRWQHWVSPEVEGLVVDANTGKPIKGATVVYANPKFGTRSLTTDSNGQFRASAHTKRLKGAFIGDVVFITQFRAEAVGYKSVDVSLPIHTAELSMSRPPSAYRIQFFLVKDTSDESSRKHVTMTRHSVFGAMNNSKAEYGVLSENEALPP